MRKKILLLVIFGTMLAIQNANCENIICEHHSYHTGSGEYKCKISGNTHPLTMIILKKLTPGTTLTIAKVNGKMQPWPGSPKLGPEGGTIHRGWNKDQLFSKRLPAYSLIGRICNHHDKCSAFRVIKAGTTLTVPSSSFYLQIGINETKPLSHWDDNRGEFEVVIQPM